MNVVAGIKPTGVLHLGHMASVIRPMQAVAPERRRIFLADLHARTQIPKDEIRANVRDMSRQLARYFESVIVQSNYKREILDLTLDLQCVCPLPLANRSVAVKGAEAPTVGHMTYPIMQAADIYYFGRLVYLLNFDTKEMVYASGNSERAQVLVGPDQLPHIELGNDLYRKAELDFYAEPLIVTEAVPGIDGQKMSKSKGNEIPLFELDFAVKQIKRIVTDSTPVDAPKPVNSTLYKIMLAIDPNAKDAIAAMFESGDSYGRIKQSAADLYAATFH